MPRHGRAAGSCGGGCDIGEVMEQELLILKRNLLRLAIYNISYIRGLFHEKYFVDEWVPTLGMTIKVLMPIDNESRRLIDWIERGVSDALQKKYLKTVRYYVYEEKNTMIEEYAFTFTYPKSNCDKVAINISCVRSKCGITTSKSNAFQVNHHRKRIFACEMIRLLVSLMRALEPMPEERTIGMKLLYYDDVTPEDYEPPLFKPCHDNEARDTCEKNPLNMERVKVDNKQPVLALEWIWSVDKKPHQDDNFSETKVHPSEANNHPNDASHEKDLTTQVKEWIYSRRETGTLNVSDVLSNFPDIPMEMIEDIMERLLKDGVLHRKSKDGHTNKITHAKLLHAEDVIMHYVPATVLDHEVPMDDMAVARFQGNLDGQAHQATKIVHDGYVKNSTNKILDKSAVHSESTNRKLFKIKRVLKGNELQMVIDTNRDHSETESKCVLVGSNVTGIQELQEVQQNVSMQSRQIIQATDPTAQRGAYDYSMESEMLVQKIKRSLIGADQAECSKDKQSRIGSKDSERATVGRILCINPQPALNFWNLDSGASHHICGGYTWVKNKRELPKEEQQKFYNAANKRVKFDEVGDILSRRLRLHDVYVSKDLEQLELYISVGQLTSNGYSVVIGDQGNFTIHMTQEFNHIVGRGSLDDKRMAYMVPFLNDSVLERESTEVLKEDLMDEDNIDEKVEDEWVLDSGCPYHVTNNESSLTRTHRLKRGMILNVAGEGSSVSMVQGDVSIVGLQLKSVYLCSKFRNNLISVARLNLLGYRFFFSRDACYITYRNENNLLGLAHKDIGNNNYYLQFFHSK